MTDYKYRGSETIALEEAWERAHNPALWPKRGSKKPSLCGTPGGYWAHHKNGTPYCDPCRYAKTLKQAAYRGKTPTGRRNNMSPDKCGTIYGYHLHLAADEPACFPCRLASANTRAQYPDRRTKQHQTPPSQPVPSDMSAAHKALRARTAERIENLEHLITAGVPDEEAATRAGWPTLTAAARALQRAGHPYGNRLDRTMRATRRQQAKDAA